MFLTRTPTRLWSRCGHLQASATGLCSGGVAARRRGGGDVHPERARACARAVRLLLMTRHGGEGLGVMCERARRRRFPTGSVLGVRSQAWREQLLSPAARAAVVWQSGLGTL